MIFSAVTGVDPLTLLAREEVALDLGLDPRVALDLRKIASDELKATAITPNAAQLEARP